MPEYVFDVKFFAAVRVSARSRRAARRLIETLSGRTASLGTWPDGTDVSAVVEIDGEADLLDEDERSA
jgi:hypothetical protein